jgi:hypothetical protein
LTLQEAVSTFKLSTNPFRRLSRFPASGFYFIMLEPRLERFTAAEIFLLKVQEPDIERAARTTPDKLFARPNLLRSQID